MVVLEDSYFNQFFLIMEEAFPVEERRTYKDQKALLQREDYHVVGIVEDEQVKAFLTYYKENGYCFVEHLATHHTTRGSGVGRKLLEDFLQTCTNVVLFEVELPESEIAKRRIQFYKRLGCYLYPEVVYIQPALQAGVSPLPLYIMSTKYMDNASVEAYCKRIYEDVYGIKELEIK